MDLTGDGRQQAVESLTTDLASNGLRGVTVTTLMAAGSRR